MNIDAQIRRLVMQDLHRVKQLTLTHHARQMVLNIEENGSYSAAGYYNDHGGTIQSVSQKLKHLYDTGYLQREEVVCMTGGIFYVYKLVEGLRETQAEEEHY